MAKLGKSILACVLANLVGWAFGMSAMYLVQTTTYEQPLLPTGISLSNMLLGVVIAILAPSLFSLIPSAAIGLPVQALLQKFRLTGLISHVLTALLIGFPVTIAWMVYFVSDRSGFTWNQLQVQSVASLFLFGCYLLCGSITFWLIRRPDRDGLTKPVETPPLPREAHSHRRQT